MQAALDALIDILDLEELEVNLFRGRSPKEDRQRVFGGQVAGQALVAAGRTVEDRSVHSLHAYFLRPGDPRVPIIYQVERIRDGKSFATRRVTAVQHGAAIFALSASFAREEPGLEHQATMPDVPHPDALPTFHDQIRPQLEKAPAAVRAWLERERPIDMRSADAWDVVTAASREPVMNVWIRADGKLPEDPLLHQCVVAYASDMTLIDAAVRPHAIGWVDDRYQIASLDHVMWFHRPVRADQWLLYAQESPNMFGARGFTTARLFAEDGTLVLSVAQESLVRPVVREKRGAKT
ncbi:MAG: acyl-CoA thioesterase II [Proteobacteria bacterium]|nr:acyl-CoA thioesterase II [Pseudomonadota bacterium]